MYAAFLPMTFVPGSTPPSKIADEFTSQVISVRSQEIKQITTNVGGRRFVPALGGRVFSALRRGEAYTTMYTVRARPGRLSTS